MEINNEELEAIKFFEAIIWHSGDGQICPHCDSKRKFYKIKSKSARPGLWKCADCRKQFTVRIGTMMEGSPLSFREWKRIIEIFHFEGEKDFYKKIEQELNFHRATSIYLKYRWKNEANYSELKKFTKIITSMVRNGLLRREKKGGRTIIIKSNDKFHLTDLGKEYQNNTPQNSIKITQI